MPMGPTRVGAGQRRHLSQLQKAVVSTDAIGGREALRWETFAIDWWVALNEQPFLKDEQDAALTYLVTGVYRPDVVDHHARKIMQRVVVSGKTLKVVLVQNPELRNRDLILHCVEAD